MLAKAFGVPRYFLWNPLTYLIRSFLLSHFCSCPNCGSENIVRDGFGERETMPDIPMLECNDCGRDFCLRADTTFYWKHASMGELFIITGSFSAREAGTGPGSGFVTSGSTAVWNGSKG